MQISDLIPWGRDKGDAPAERNGSASNPLAALQGDLNAVFDTFWKRLENGRGDRAGPVGPHGPSTDVTEAEDHVEVSVELPGMTEDDIEVALSGDALTIRGEKKVEHEEKRKGVYLSERAYGAFYRTIPLPAGVDTDRAEARFARGVLTVTLAKTAEAQARVKRVPVKAA